MHNKHLFRLWIALVTIALTSGVYLLLPNKVGEKQISIPVPSSNITSTNPTPEKQASQPKIPRKNEPATNTKKTTTTTTSTTAPTEPETYAINITIEINGQKYPVGLAEKSTAYDAMSKLVADKKIAATFKEFSGMGYFVDEIDGVKTDNKNGKYWIYYLNNEPAKMGISAYVLKNTDLITWKYENSKF